MPTWGALRTKCEHVLAYQHGLSEGLSAWRPDRYMDSSQTLICRCTSEFVFCLPQGTQLLLGCAATSIRVVRCARRGAQAADLAAGPTKLSYATTP